jgi:uncharacterized membrane protein HdeD (DUF308 family)
MLQAIADSWWVFLVRGLAAIGFGVLALIWPEITLGALVIVFGVYALFDGIMDIVLGVGVGRDQRGHRLSSENRIWLVLMGLVSVAAGVIAFVWPAITAVALVWVIAFWAIVTGLVELFLAWRLRAELTNEWMWVLSGLLSIGLGVVLVVQPTAGALALVLWIGLLAIAWGVTLCITAFRLRGLRSRTASAPA